MKDHIHHFAFVFVAFLFLGIVSVELFSDGMFMDGLLYADISRNLAAGLGSFWKPHLTQTLFNEFYEHPPLAFGLQSLFFSMFGDSIYVERLYSLLTYLIVGYLIVVIWSKFTGEKRTGWMPLFFWVTTSGVAWAAANNMLENTMTVFVCCAVVFYLNSFTEKRFLWVALAGLSLSLALLTKGFVCLYVWSMPFFIWISARQKGALRMSQDTLALALFTLLPIAILYFLVPEAQNNMHRYFEKQVIGSIQNVETVSSRFAIVVGFLQSVAIPLVIGLLVAVCAFIYRVDRTLYTKNGRESLMLLAVVLSGVLPIMISLKQRNFYILSVYPLFSIALAYYLLPLVRSLAIEVKAPAWGQKVYKGLTAATVVAAIALTLSQFGRVGRDRDMISDTKTVIEYVGKNVRLSICPEMHSNWSLHGYMSRYGNVSLDNNPSSLNPYFLTVNDCADAVITTNYTPVDLDLKEFALFALNTDD